MNKYPKQFNSIGRRDKVMGVASAFGMSTKQDWDENKLSPMEMLQSWSGIKFNVSDSKLNAGGDGNIEAKKLSDVRIRTEHAMRYVMEAEMQRTDGDDAEKEKSGASVFLEQPISYLPKDLIALRGQSSIAICGSLQVPQIKNAIDTLVQGYQNAKQKGDQNNANRNLQQINGLRFAMVALNCGKMKIGDYTISDILKNWNQFAQYVQTMFQQNPQIQNSVEGYVLMTAIECGNSIPNFINLVTDESALKEEATMASTKGIQIYKEVLKTPSMKTESKGPHAGLRKAYRLSVTCYPQMKQPFTLKLTTMYGQPLGDNKVGIKESSAVDKKTFTMTMESWEWLNIIEDAEWLKRLYQIAAFPTALVAANAYDAENRQGSHAAQPQQYAG